MSAIHSSLSSSDKSRLFDALSHLSLALRNLISDNIDFYANNIKAHYRSSNSNNFSSLTRASLQQLVDAANQEALHATSLESATKAINHAIRHQDEERLLATLSAPEAQLPEPTAYAASLYLDEFGNMMSEKETDLSYEELVGGLNVLNAIASINAAVDVIDPKRLVDALRHTFAHIADVETEDESMIRKYLQTMSAVQRAKRKMTPHCPLLSHADIQDCVDRVNKASEEEEACVTFVKAVNKAVDEEDANALMAAFKMGVVGNDGVTSGGLLSSLLGGETVDDFAGPLYLSALQKAKETKRKQGEDLSLWKEDIVFVVAKANKNAATAHLLSLAVHKINVAIDKRDFKLLKASLAEPAAALIGVLPDCFESYAVNLFEAKDAKRLAGNTSTWVVNALRDGTLHYFNVDNLETSWKKPRGFKAKQSIMFSNSEVQDVVNRFNSAFDYAKLLKANEALIVKIQARVRGFLVRRARERRKDFMAAHLPAVVTIQSWWRMVRQRWAYLSRLETFEGNVDKIVKIQTWWRMILDRDAYLEVKNHYRKHEESVIKIQSWYRANKAKKNYRALMTSDRDNQLAVNVVSRFVHLLDNSEQVF